MARMCVSPERCQTGQGPSGTLPVYHVVVRQRDESVEEVSLTHRQAHRESWGPHAIRQDMSIGGNQTVLKPSQVLPVLPPTTESGHQCWCLGAAPEQPRLRATAFSRLGPVLLASAVCVKLPMPYPQSTRRSSTAKCSSCVSNLMSCMVRATQRADDCNYCLRTVITELPLSDGVAHAGPSRLRWSLVLICIHSSRSLPGV
jgi:hypothetical protein